MDDDLCVQFVHFFVHTLTHISYYLQIFLFSRIIIFSIIYILGDQNPNLEEREDADIVMRNICEKDANS